jgi:hypothetical protein
MVSAISAMLMELANHVQITTVCVKLVPEVPLFFGSKLRYRGGSSLDIRRQSRMDRDSGKADSDGPSKRGSERVVWRSGNVGSWNASTGVLHAGSHCQQIGIREEGSLEQLHGEYLRKELRDWDQAQGHATESQEILLRFAIHVGWRINFRELFSLRHEHSPTNAVKSKSRSRDHMTSIPVNFPNGEADK